MDEKVTKPTIETVLERMTVMEERIIRITGMGERLDERFTGLDERVFRLDERLAGLDGRVVGLDQRVSELYKRMSVSEDRLHARLDRMESVINATRGDSLELRTDIRG